tara:strand:- start:2219 stop:2701 length:483 start_codon:yes stop_codon:yes gene_type:complete
MSEAVATPVEIRKQLRTIPATDFVKAHTKAALVEKASLMGIEVDDGGTKTEIYEAIVAGANLPDPSLRGKSTKESPVAAVWGISDLMVAAVPQENRAKRSEVVAACQAEGIAYYTARTQFQAWFSATDKGRRRLDDLSLEELPKALHPEVEVEEEEATDG